jgi:hypothetical protein
MPKPSPRGGLLSAYHPGWSEWLGDKAGSAISGLLGSEKAGARWGDRARSFFDMTPVGALDAILSAPNTPSGDLNRALAVLPLPGPGRRVAKEAAEALEDVFRGVSSVSPRAGNYYTGDREWARQFTQSGRDEEILHKKIPRAAIYSPDKLPSAVREEDLDAAILEARKRGHKAVRVDEGDGEPPSVFVFDRSALRDK